MFGNRILKVLALAVVWIMLVTSLISCGPTPEPTQPPAVAEPTEVVVEPTKVPEPTEAPPPTEAPAHRGTPTTGRGNEHRHRHPRGPSGIQWSRE